MYKIIYIYYIRNHTCINNRGSKHFWTKLKKKKKIVYIMCTQFKYNIIFYVSIRYKFKKFRP